MRPPVSPITPTLGPTQFPGDVPTSTSLASSAVKASSTGATTTSTTTKPTSTAAGAGAVAPGGGVPDFAQGRQTFSHSQPDQVGIVLPPAEPIAFEDNPDVLAIQSAISILQFQRAKAMADMQALKRAKNDALADPAAFLADLQAGRVRTEGDRLFVETAEEDDDDDDSSSDDDAEAGEDGPAAGQTEPAAGGAGKPKPKGQGKSAHGARSWQKLPKPQNVVRTPPVNWGQYGVVGESLDKLHAEQVAAPTQGMPSVLGPGRTFEFKAGDQQPAGEQRRLVGVAAPYAPGKDKLDKKGKGAKR